MEKKPLGYYDYTVILTYCAMLFGFSGIMLAIEGRFWKAIVCLMIAGGCDMFDGLVASTKERTRSEKRFGIQIDSMSDLVNFGIMPAVFLYMICNRTRIIAIISSLYALCALIRLSYFNVLEEERQDVETEARKAFLGVPVTTIALMLPLIYLLFDMGIFKNILSYPMIFILMGAAYLSPIEIKKPGMSGKIAILVIGLCEVFGLIMFKG